MKMQEIYLWKHEGFVKYEQNPLQTIFSGKIAEKMVIVKFTDENTSIHCSEKKIALFTLGKIAQCE